MTRRLLRMKAYEVAGRLVQRGAGLAASQGGAVLRLGEVAGRLLRWLGELIRYWLVAFACFVLDIGALVALRSFTPLALAADTAVAFGLTAVVGLVLNRWWVFPHAARSGRPSADFTRYFVSAVAALIVTTVLVSGLAGVGIDYRIAKVVVSGVVAALNFFVVRQWVFHRGAPAPQPTERRQSRGGAITGPPVEVSRQGGRAAAHPPASEGQERINEPEPILLRSSIRWPLSSVHPRHRSDAAGRLMR